MQIAAKMYVDGERIFCAYRRGAAVREIPNVGTIHQYKTKGGDVMLVRIDGIWMFNWYVGSGHGRLVLELDRASVEVLTSNRDSMKSDARDAVNKVVHELMVNPESALRKKDPEVMAILPGTGRVRVGSDKLEDLHGMLGSRQALAGEMLEMFVAAGTDGEVAQARAEQLSKVFIDREGSGWIKLERMAKMAAYKPDFVVRFKKSQKKKANKFVNYRKAGVLAKLWTEMVKQILLDCGKDIEFTAGFTFDPAIEAQLVTEGGNYYFLLNPTNVGPMSPKWVLGEEVKDRAIHEATHLWRDYHDESFVNRMAQVRRKTRLSHRVYNKIKKM
jgi:hypothetical protein